MFSKTLGAQTKLSATKCRFPSSNVARVLRGFRWMSKEPAEIFERAADDGFVTQACGLDDQLQLTLDMFIDSENS